MITKLPDGTLDISGLKVPTPQTHPTLFPGQPVFIPSPLLSPSDIGDYGCSPLLSLPTIVFGPALPGGLPPPHPVFPSPPTYERQLALSDEAKAKRKSRNHKRALSRAKARELRRSAGEQSPAAVALAPPAAIPVTAEPGAGGADWIAALYRPYLPPA